MSEFKMHMVVRWELGNEETHYFSSYQEAIDFIKGQDNPDVWQYFSWDIGSHVDITRGYRSVLRDQQASEGDGECVPESE